MRVRQGLFLAIVSAIALIALATQDAGAHRSQSQADYGTAIVNITREEPLSIQRVAAASVPGRSPIVGDFLPDTAAGVPPQARATTSTTTPPPEGSKRLEEVLWYTPGRGGDAIWRTTEVGRWDTLPIDVSGTYLPIVGRFPVADGDIADSQYDIFWYAPGPATDWVWDFNDDGTISKHSYQVNGTYTPITGSFDWDSQDIVWYAPGPTPDWIWDFHNDGTVTSRPLRIDGTYQPLVGKFDGYGGTGQDDIMWFGRGAAPDAYWDFNEKGEVRQQAIRIDSTATPITGDFTGDGFGDILWYAPGTAPDVMWDFDSNVLAKTRRPLTIDGTFVPLARALFAVQGGGIGPDDILWFGPGTAPDRIWDFTWGGTYTSRPITLDGDRTPAIARLWDLGYAVTYSASDVIDLYR